MPDNLELGLQAAQMGETEKAVTYLSKYVLENPGSEVGWSYLGDCLQAVEKRKYCYEQVLKINPANQIVRQRLNEIVNQILSQPNSVRIEKPDVSSSNDNLESRTRTKKINPVPIIILGILLGITVLGIPLIFLLPKSPSVSPTAALTTSNSFTPTLQETNTPTITITASATLPPTATLDLSGMATPLIGQAEALMAKLQYADAIPVLNQAISIDPNSDQAYYLRATSYYQLLAHQRVLSEFQDYLSSGLNDIDTAISIEPNKGDYYMLRQDLLQELASIQDYRVDRERINNYAAENAQIALNLGSTLEDNPERIYPTDLIDAGRCAEAINLFQNLIDNTAPNDVHINGLYSLQSQAYICTGDVNKAISLVKKSMADNIDMDNKNLLLATYLFLDGQDKTALGILNDLIEKNPDYDGERYYLRAAIYFEFGNMNQAESDLQTGEGNTWFQVGLRPYVLGEMALAGGQTQDGIQLLQNAEATLELRYSPLIKQIQTKLNELGAAPLEVTPSVMQDATPIPTVLPQPTSRPFGTTVASSSVNRSMATPIPGLNFPSGFDNAYIFDPETGTGKIVLKPNDYPMFRLQPAKAQKVKTVKNIVINLITFTQTQAPAIQIYMYSPTGGGWKFLEPVWGENPVENPEDLVYPTGDMIIAIRNYGITTVTIDNLTITIVFESGGGETIKIGP